MISVMAATTGRVYRTRGGPSAHIHGRIRPEVKSRAESNAERLGISLSRYMEIALAAFDDSVLIEAFDDTEPAEEIPLPGSFAEA
jgi:hypothetical protein